MNRMARPLGTMKPHYTAVVIGSGYGASIAACRLARAGQTVCLLERGRELLPGEYPNDPIHAIEEFQFHLPGKDVIGRQTGMFDLRVNEDINVTLGCGLGGTSLINANVAVEPEPRVFNDPRWPKALRDDVADGLQKGYKRANAMLQPTPYPNEVPLPKLAAQQKSAAQTGGKFTVPPIAVTFKDRNNAAGVFQNACTLCGDCCSGCNVGAKNTLVMNYLPEAARHGAEIFTQTLVRSVRRDGNQWAVDYSAALDPKGPYDTRTRSVTADIVVIGAGALGSTEILLRSRSVGLATSDVLGDRFTGNGDVLGFAFNSETKINGMGWGHNPPGVVPPVGPCITTLIDLREQPTLEDGFVIEEGSIPGAVAGLIEGPLALAAGVSAANSVSEIERLATTMLFGPYRGALNMTQTYLVMSHDDGAGRMELVDDKLRIHWPGVGSQPIFEKVNAKLTKAADALDGTYVPNPVWNSALLRHALVTVHPLGGCVMGDSAERGVVNDRLQVYSGAAGTHVHPGLYVMDGAVIPRPLGVNPFLTISAVAERAMALMAAERGWVFDES